MGKYELLATGALLFNMSSFATLLHNVHQTKNTSTLPWKWVVLNISAQILLIIYGLLNGAWGIYVPTIILLSGLFYIAYVKWHYESDFQQKENRKQI